MSAQASLVAIGDVLANKYRVDRVLGIGGMGMVVAATHLELEQRVALKFMLPGALESTEATDRFLREARAAVRLRSEHICRVLDVGKLETGAPYIVMEYLEGHDFAEILAQRGTLGVTETVDLLLQMLEGVAEAHANQIVHRDLKPANLFVAQDSDGSPLIKILDFGISKSSIGVAATKTGEMMGSPAYMAPEQMLSSKDVDARADVWAIGVIAYQAVCGRRPFDAETLPALCMNVMNAPTPPLSCGSQVFANIVMRCLEKPRETRYADVGELALALAPLGSRGADVVAAKIAKVLRRAAPAGTGSAVAVSTMQTGPTALFAATQASLVAAPAIGPDTTFGAGAGEAVQVAKPRPPARRRTIAMAGAVLGLVIGFVVVGVHGSSTDTGRATTEPRAAASPPAAPAPAPIVKQVEPTPIAPPAPEPAPPAPTPPAITPPAASTPAAPKHPKIAKPATPKPLVPIEAKPVEKSPEPAPVESQWTHMHHDGKQ